MRRCPEETLTLFTSGVFLSVCGVDQNNVCVTLLMCCFSFIRMGPHNALPCVVEPFKAEASTHKYLKVCVTWLMCYFSFNRMGPHNALPCVFEPFNAEASTHKHL